MNAASHVGRFYGHKNCSFPGMDDMIEPTFRHWFGFDPSHTEFGTARDWYVVQSGTKLTDRESEEVKRVLESQFAEEAIWVTDRRNQILLCGVVTAHQSLSLTSELEQIFNYSAGQPEDGRTLEGDVWTPKRKIDRTDSLTLRNLLGRYSLTGIQARG